MAFCWWSPEKPWGSSSWQPIGLLPPSAKIKCHENSSGEFVKFRETPPSLKIVKFMFTSENNSPLNNCNKFQSNACIIFGIIDITECIGLRHRIVFDNDTNKIRTVHYFGYNLLIYRAIHNHDDVTKWKHFPRNWPFVRGIHRFPANSSHKGQWRGALMFSLICIVINNWVNNREAGDLRRYRAHFDVIVVHKQCLYASKVWRTVQRLNHWTTMVP